jgi:hypothetical protein
MEKIYINSNDGCICSALDYDLTLGRLIYLIKYDYPQVENDDFKIINKGIILTDNEKTLTEQGVSINVDRLRIVPVKIWKKFEQTKEKHYI